MSISRRTLLKSSAALTAASTLAPTIAVAAPRAPAPPQQAPTADPPPSIGIIAMNRMAYGPRPGDVDRVNLLGLAAYVDEQLSPVDSDDPANAKIAAATLNISYYTGQNTPPVNENRPLQRLDSPLGDLWALAIGNKNDEEKRRPAQEVRAATWLRALYSKWQLREVLVEFWHNHFNIDAFLDYRITALWPLYDREVIRANWGGNFRTLLGAVAKSTPMLYYLDNVYSKDGPANENYAREMFELHTLGRPNYLNGLYNRWRDVPGAPEGKPVGYIDEDVYEAARALTGWTVADGRDFGTDKQNTGAFKYVNSWHDNAQKRVLATEFAPNQAPLADGEQVLDLVARHPGTASYICTKLCRRLVADEPSAALVQVAIDVWIAHQDAADQIKQVVRAILLSPEFAATWGQKIKRPFELVASFLRITEASVTPNTNLFNWLSEMGYRHFNWSPPTGHPDTAGDWLSTNVTLRRWNVVNTFFTKDFGAATLDLVAKTPGGATSRQIVAFWVERVLGRPLPERSVDVLIGLMRQDAGPDMPPIGNAEDIRDRINSLVALIAMTPEFQQR